MVQFTWLQTVLIRAYLPSAESVGLEPRPGFLLFLSFPLTLNTSVNCAKNALNGDVDVFIKEDRADILEQFKVANERFTTFPQTLANILSR